MSMISEIPELFLTFSVLHCSSLSLDLLWWECLPFLVPMSAFRMRDYNKSSKKNKYYRTIITPVKHVIAINWDWYDNVKIRNWCVLWFSTIVQTKISALILIMKSRIVYIYSIYFNL